MKRYELYLKEVLIGILEVDTVNQKHRYTPTHPQIKEIAKTYPLDRVHIDGSNGWVKPIPFFYTRIQQMERWNLTQISYQTDRVLLKLCE